MRTRSSSADALGPKSAAQMRPRATSTDWLWGRGAGAESDIGAAADKPAEIERRARALENGIYRRIDAAREDSGARSHLHRALPHVGVGTQCVWQQRHGRPSAHSRQRGARVR